MVNKTRTLSAAVLALVVAAGLSCRSNRAPDIPAAPAGPEYCFKDTTYVFQTVVSDPDGESVAVRFDWDDSTPAYWVGWFASGETVAFTHAWSDTGNHEVRVLAQDRELLASDSSDGLMVRVVVRWPPETPAAPLGPDLGGLDTSYKFIAGADHPDGIPVAIRFAWGDGDTSDWSPFVPSGGPVSAKHAWSVPDSYAVTAQAKDTGELTSLWSAPHSIFIRPPGWSRLRMVGAPILTPDSSSFRIAVVNEGTVDVTVSSLEFLESPESTYMRDFTVEGNHGSGYPIPNGMPGTGPGDTVGFAPVTIAPDMSQMSEFFFMQFHADEPGNGAVANVGGKEFVFRFDDGSVIAVTP